MGIQKLQISELPTETVVVMEARAHAEGMSLAEYVRRMVIKSAAHANVAEVLARSSHRSSGISMADVVTATHKDRDVEAVP